MHACCYCCMQSFISLSEYMNLCGSMNSDYNYDVIYVVTLPLSCMHNFHVVLHHFPHTVVYGHIISCSLFTAPVITILFP